MGNDKSLEKIDRATLDRLERVEENVNITIVENIQENNYYENPPAPVIDMPKKVKKRSLTAFLALMTAVLLIIAIIVLYWSFDIDLAFWQKQSERTEVKTPTYSRETLNAPVQDKPVHIEQKCYGFVIPYPIFKSTQRDTCSVFVSLRSPRGHVTVDYRIKESDDVLPDVTMRRMNAKKYVETRIELNETPMILFQNMETEGYEKTAFFEKKGAHIAVTLKTDVPNTDRDTVFGDILKSFYCKNECVYAP